MGAFVAKWVLKLAGNAVGGWILGYAKWIGLGAAALVVIGIAWKIHSFIDEKHALEEQVRGTITNLTQDLVIAQTEAQSRKDTITRMQLDKIRLEALQEQLIQTQREIRDEVRAQKDIFTKPREHSFDELVNAKPGLIEKMANARTQERLDALEHTFND